MADITVTVEKIGVEDIQFWSAGNATFSRTTSTGGTQTINAVSAKDIPVEDASSYWTAANVEDVLDDMHDGTDPLIINNTFIKSRNAANSGNVDLIKANSSNLIELGAAPAAATFGFCPIGSIVAFLPGSFGDGSHGTYTFRLGTANSIAAINTLLNAAGWYVCDGAAVNVAGSPIFNAAGRYLPNLTTDRFLMGDTAGGGIGGDNAMAHIHATANHTLTVAEMPVHNHEVYGYTYTGSASSTRFQNNNAGDLTTRTTSNTGGNSGHNHGNTGAATVTENRPLYLACFYIIRIF